MKITLFLGTLVAALWATNGMAQQNGAASRDKPEPLAGSGWKLEDVAKECNVIFTGQVTEKIVGEGFQKTAGTRIHFGVPVKVLQMLKGAIKSTANVTVPISYADTREVLPRVGISYIFFVKQEPGNNTVFKILPATDANIGKTKQLIGAAAQ